MATFSGVCITLTVGLLFIVGANAESPTPLLDANFCVNKPNGLYVFIYACSQFIQCSNHLPYLFSCAATQTGLLYYNDITSQCDWPDALTAAQIAACSQPLPTVPAPTTTSTTTTTTTATTTTTTLPPPEKAMADAIVIGRSIVSCPSGTTLLSCSFNNSQTVTYDPLRLAVPINSTSCACSDQYGFHCIARCGYPVEGFEIVKSEKHSGTGYFQARCTTGKKVLGCHISRDDTDTAADPYVVYKPISDGSGCECWDKYNAYCVATCASSSNIGSYEILRTYGFKGPITQSCSSGNYVFGVAFISGSPQYQPFPYTMVVTDAFQGSSCSNGDGFLNCYAICGRLGITEIL